MKTLKEGSKIHQVYNALLFHEYMNQDTIAKKLNIGKYNLSSYLTKLRRMGLAEYDGKIGSLKWKAHHINNPLYPPQDDLKRRKNSKKENVTPSNRQIKMRCMELVGELFEEVKKLDSSEEFVEVGTLNGEKVYKKC